ncbi:MAG: hypothetical protein ACHQDD_00960 [Steroidobacterales bacterium]
MRGFHAACAAGAAALLASLYSSTPATACTVAAMRTALWIISRVWPCARSFFPCELLHSPQPSRHTLVFSVFDQMQEAVVDVVHPHDGRHRPRRLQMGGIQVRSAAAWGFRPQVHGRILGPRGSIVQSIDFMMTIDAIY